MIPLPIDLIPGIPLRFRWSQTIETPIGRKVVVNEGALGLPSVEEAVAASIKFIKELQARNDGLRAENEGLRQELELALRRGLESTTKLSGPVSPPAAAVSGVTKHPPAARADRR